MRNKPERHDFINSKIMLNLVLILAKLGNLIGYIKRFLSMMENNNSKD